MRTAWRLITDLDLGVLRAHGPDAIRFLQGQLSNDLAAALPGQLQLSGYHSPQGRAIAVLRLAVPAADEIVAILPRELVDVVVERLRRYVLRAKVQISDDCARWQVLGFHGDPPALPDGALIWPYGLTRCLVLAPQGAALPEAQAVRGARSDWIARDIEEGLPQVYAATSEEFVAQMLNLDVAGGIAFDKGCYTGQEIIARAHYRGHVKRRMQRFISEAPCELAPGDSGMLGDGRSFKVVAAAPAAAGRCEFLAVTNPPPGTDAQVPIPADDAESALVATQILIPARQLELPYPLPAARA